MEERHLYTRINGTVLHWVELGAKSDLPRPPVVLLHGLSDSHLAWKHVAPLLARDRRVLMPDLAGHGLSGRPDSTYTLSWHAETMAEWMTDIGLTSVDVVGHSLGGGIAQMLLLHPDHPIRRVILASSGGLGREIGLPLKLAATPFAVEHLGQPFMELATRMALRSEGTAFSDEDIRKRSSMNAQRGSARAFARTVRDIIDWRGQTRTFFERAHEVKRLPPMAVYWGDRDAIIPLRHGQSFVESVQGVELTAFPGCGHHLHGEQPQAFASAVRSFFDRDDVPAPRLRSVPRPPPRSVRDSREPRESLWARLQRRIGAQGPMSSGLPST